jgi:hypothetical protein
MDGNAFTEYMNPQFLFPNHSHILHVIICFQFLLLQCFKYIFYIFIFLYIHSFIHLLAVLGFARQALYS